MKKGRKPPIPHFHRKLHHPAKGIGYAKKPKTRQFQADIPLRQTAERDAKARLSHLLSLLHARRRHRRQALLSSDHKA